MDERRKLLKRKHLVLKTKKIPAFRATRPSANTNHSKSTNSSIFDRTGLKRKNKVLASSLNDARLQNAALCQRLNQFNAQMLELREEITELKREKQIIKSTARNTETEIQRKLDTLIGPLRSNLNQAYNHVSGLTDNLTLSISMLQSLQTQSDRSQNRLSEELKGNSRIWNLQNSNRSAHLKDTPPQATVSPRVMGHEIHKPKIRIARLDMSAFRNGGAVVMAADDQHRDRPEELPDQDSAVDTTVAGQEVEQEDAPIIVRSRRRRQRPINPAPAMGSIVENIEEEEREGEEIEGEEMVLLFPRLVLERIRVTPSRQNSRRPSNSNNPEVERNRNDGGGADADSETPRSRESFEDFTRRLGGLDPLEGPSWLFNDEENPTPTTNNTNVKQKATKARDEKRQENSLKARLSSASRRLSLDEAETNTEENPTSVANEVTGTVDVAATSQQQSQQSDAQSESVEEEPSRRRGGSRAASQAARSNLKEQGLNTKLRQGDRNSQSVYDDFVPGTKRKSEKSTDRKSAKNKQRKKSEDKKDEQPHPKK